MEFSISQMAQMHGLTRQTLIYYDKIGLFHPARVNENGMRYYTAEQMPFLREICMLRGLDMSLKDIQDLLQSNDKERKMEILKGHLTHVESMQKQLQLREHILKHRLSMWERANYGKQRGQKLFVEHFETRKALFLPWPSAEMDTEQLHLCFARAHKILKDCGLEPNYGFGSMVWRDKISQGTPLTGAGSLFFVPEIEETEKIAEEQVIFLPEGDYLCMYFCGMPYRLEPIFEFWEQICRLPLKTKGNIYTRCLLDSVFHSDQQQEDYCQFQILLE